MGKMDPCNQPRIFESMVLARDSHRFTARVTVSLEKELKNVITSMIEERTEGTAHQEHGRRRHLARAGF